MFNRIRLSRTGPFAALALLLAGHSYAQLITPTSQDRSLRADTAIEGGGPTDSDSFDAQDFGPVATSISAGVVDPGSGDRANASAAQTSTITGTSIAASGSFSAAATGWSGRATGVSRCQVTFTLSQTCRYDLSGVVSAFDNGGSLCSLLSADGYRVFATQALGFSSTNTFNVSGVMLPGTYIFEASGGGEAVEPSPSDFGSGSFDVDLQLSAATGGDCSPTSNSSGSPAILAFLGDLAVGSTGTFVTVSQGPPGHWGLLFYGDSMSPAAFGNGVLCVSNPLFRVGPARQFDPQGRVFQNLAYSVPPLSTGAGQVVPGSSWTFQFWFRDFPGAGGDAWNTSSAVTVTFAP